MSTSRNNKDNGKRKAAPVNEVPSENQDEIIGHVELMEIRDLHTVISNYQKVIRSHHNTLTSFTSIFVINYILEELFRRLSKNENFRFLSEPEIPYLKVGYVAILSMIIINYLFRKLIVEAYIAYSVDREAAMAPLKDINKLMTKKEAREHIKLLMKKKNELKEMLQNLRIRGFVLSALIFTLSANDVVYSKNSALTTSVSISNACLSIFSNLYVAYRSALITENPSQIQKVLEKQMNQFKKILEDIVTINKEKIRYSEYQFFLENSFSAVKLPQPHAAIGIFSLKSTTKIIQNFLESHAIDTDVNEDELIILGNCELAQITKQEIARLNSELRKEFANYANIKTLKDQFRKLAEKMNVDFISKTSENENGKPILEFFMPIPNRYAVQCKKLLNECFSKEDIYQNQRPAEEIALTQEGEESTLYISFDLGNNAQSDERKFNTQLQLLGINSKSDYAIPHEDNNNTQGKTRKPPKKPTAKKTDDHHYGEGPSSSSEKKPAATRWPCGKTEEAEDVSMVTGKGFRPKIPYYITKDVPPKLADALGPLYKEKVSPEIEKGHLAGGRLGATGIRFITGMSRTVKDTDGKRVHPTAKIKFLGDKDAISDLRIFCIEERKPDGILLRPVAYKRKGHTSRDE